MIAAYPLFKITRRIKIEKQIRKILEEVFTLNKSIYLIFFLRLFFILFGLNLFSLFSFNYAWIRLPIYSLTLGLTFWIILAYINLFFNFKRFVTHWVSDNTPLFLIPFVIIVEILRFFTRPLRLTIRISANISAGHILTFFCKRNIMLTIRLVCMEIPIRIIQAFVFVLLLKSYFKERH